MARVTKTRKPEALPTNPLEAMMRDHLHALAVQNYSTHTVRNRQVHIGYFVQWCRERGLTAPVEVTRPVLERYQRQPVPPSQKERGAPELPVAALVPRPPARLVPMDDPAESHPPQSRVRAGVAQAWPVPAQEHLLRPGGGADHAAVRPSRTHRAARPGRSSRCCTRPASAGWRTVQLKLYDLSLDRGLILIRQGQGQEGPLCADRESGAIAWLQKYIRQARPELAVEPDDYDRVPHGPGGSRSAAII